MANSSPEKKMDPALKARWLEALRSGRYPQGRKLLKTSAGAFCCLGVALDVIDSGQWRVGGWGDREEELGGPELPKFSLDDTTLLGNELGISGSACDQLAMWNDGILTAEELRATDEGFREPWTFAEIANWIEANL